MDYNSDFWKTATPYDGKFYADTAHGTKTVVVEEITDDYGCCGFPIVFVNYDNASEMLCACKLRPAKGRMPRHIQRQCPDARDNE